MCKSGYPGVEVKMFLVDVGVDVEEALEGCMFQNITVEVIIHHKEAINDQPKAIFNAIFASDMVI